jgi:hypothetical protein
MSVESDSQRTRHSIPPTSRDAGDDVEDAPLSSFRCGRFEKTLEKDALFWTRASRRAPWAPGHLSHYPCSKVNSLGRRVFELIAAELTAAEPELRVPLRCTFGSCRLYKKRGTFGMRLRCMCLRCIEFVFVFAPLSSGAVLSVFNLGSPPKYSSSPSPKYSSFLIGQGCTY